jgi:ribonuclease P protein component
MRARHRGACPVLVVHVAALAPGDAATLDHPARAGFIVGRAVGGSVQRHRVTRRLRHLMAGHLETLPDGLGVVVRALPPAVAAEGDTLATALSSCLERALRSLGQPPGTPAWGAP